MLAVVMACHGEVAPINNDAGNTPPSACPSGTDNDQDGYGPGCPAGSDCDDTDPTVSSGATEICDGKDNNCDGKIDENLSGCTATTVGAGSSPFPVDKNKDPNLQDSTGVKLDSNGDLVLGTGQVTFRYLWIANTDDQTRGTISKVDSKALKEVGRYYTITCSSVPGSTGCLDANGKSITANNEHTPSRTAVDFNMDVWVANRCLDGGQPSVTKIAADPLDCLDRNNNGMIDTSGDRDGDGKITVDCNGDGKPDDSSTKCSGGLSGKQPEFLGYDDECVLFTVNFGDKDDIARSVCLDSGKSIVGASNAWVGTYNRPENKRGPNKYYKINGYTGKIEAEVPLDAEHHAYGCTADGHHLIWSTEIGYYNTTVAGNLTYFEAMPPYRVGKILRGPTKDKSWIGRSGTYRQYGICTNADGHIWLGGIDSEWVLRFKPNRQSFDTLGNGTWTRIDMPQGMYSRGVAADLRGKLWVAIQQGYIMRLEQNIADGIHSMANVKQGVDYWKVKTGGELIGVGVDFDGHVWGVDKSFDTASRLMVDVQGKVTSATVNNVKVGKHPYTYSDFTGYGLANFVRPQGRWSYVHKPCNAGEKATWKRVTWNATTPPGTAVTLRVRTGDTLTTLGTWSGEFSKSPAEIGPGNATAISPNPAEMLQVEFTLSSADKSYSPTLHDYAVAYTCIKGVE